MKILFLNIAFCISNLFAFSPLFGRNIYVATTGSDNDVGSIDYPYLTINKAAQQAVAGDSVIIKPGTYKPNGKIITSNSGTETLPIVYCAEKPGTAIIDGQTNIPSISSREGLFFISGKSWIVIDGLRIINSGFFGVLIQEGASNIIVKNCSTYITGASGICAKNSSFVKVLNNVVQKACYAPERVSTSECITMASVNTFEVAYNTISDRLTDMNNGGEGLDAKNSCTDGSIHHNTIYDLIRHALYIDAYSGSMSNIAVNANKVYNCPKSGIVIASEEGGSMTGVKVHDNLVYNCGNIGIWVAGYLRNGPLKNIEVYQNTVYNCGGKGNYLNSGILIEASNELCSGFTFRNNIVSGCPVAIKSNVSQPFPITVDNNIFFGTIGSFSHNTSVTNTFNVDPLFIDASNPNFNLQSTSPAIDKAVGTPLSTIDFNGKSRPVGAFSDIGAFEYESHVTGINTVKMGKEEKISIAVFPNPATYNIFINHPEIKNLNHQIIVVNIGGRIELECKGVINTLQTRLDVSKLERGYYFVCYDELGGKQYTARFMKGY